MLTLEGSHDLPFILTTRLPALRVELATKSIDGFFVPPVDEASPLQQLVARDLVGIELYNIGEAPAAYRRKGLACKVLLIWRKYG